MKIIVDTREQLPLWVNSCIRQKLLVGDYSTELLQHSFCIERKSGSDLYGSILGDHIRFKKELIRAKINNIKLALYVECTLKEFVDKTFPGGKYCKCKGETLKKIITSISRNHNLELNWCSSRAVLIRKVKARLKIEEDNFVKNKKVKPTKLSCKN